MNSRPAPGHALPILGAPDPRQAMLQRMRDKLAGNSEKEAALQEMRDEARRKLAWSRAWRLLAFAAIVALTWAAYGLRGEWNVAAAPKVVPVLPAPDAKLGVDRQLLYWTYALYDVDKLRAEFGLQKRIVIDSRIAQAHIRELLPKAGPRAAFTVRRYQTNRGIMR